MCFVFLLPVVCFKSFSSCVRTLSIHIFQVLSWTSLFVINSEEQNLLHICLYSCQTWDYAHGKSSLPYFVSLRPAHLFILYYSWAIVYKCVTFTIFSRWLLSFPSDLVFPTAHLYLEVSLTLQTQLTKTEHVRTHTHTLYPYTYTPASLQGHHCLSNYLVVGHFKQWNNQPKAQKCKNMALTRPPKDTFLKYESYSKMTECCFFSTLAETLLVRPLKTFCHFAHVSVSDCKSFQVLVLEVQINFSM